MTQDMGNTFCKLNRGGLWGLRRVGSMEWERERWVEKYLSGERISEIARQFEVSRKTVYKWLERYESGQQLKESSRAPHHHPNQVEPVWRERVSGVRQEHPRWGARKLAWKLEQEHGAVPPSGISRRAAPAGTRSTNSFGSLNRNCWWA